jgi:5-methylcytosine-specific restriction endonuclease McrA
MWSEGRPKLPAEWHRLRRRVLRSASRCAQCGGVGPFDVDHVVPRSRGGTDVPSNLRALCRPCHASKTAAEGHARARELRERRLRPRDRHPGVSDVQDGGPGACR